MLAVIAGCTGSNPTGSTTRSASESHFAITPSPSIANAPYPTPSLTPEPAASSSTRPGEFELSAPTSFDEREIEVVVTPEVPANESGRILITVTSHASSMIEDLVLRWPSELNEVLFLAPFTPTPERIEPGGSPLVQPWTKWVLGPGEQGEPAGTISLGWGPLEANGTLTIPIVVTRHAPGPFTFDLQILAGESILRLPDGSLATVSVIVP